jgi:hypothetical protein
MAKATPKTLPTPAGVEAFLATVENPARRADAEAVMAMMRAITGLEPKLWGPSIIGFGEYAYKYDSGHSGVMCRVGLSPRKANLVVYLIDGYEQRADQLAALGKHKIGKSCLYLNKLSDVDTTVLSALIADSWAEMARRYPA